MAIANRAESTIFKGLDVLAESAKSFGFGNKKRKLITKQKALATS